MLYDADTALGFSEEEIAPQMKSLKSILAQDWLFNGSTDDRVKQLVGYFQGMVGPTGLAIFGLLHEPPLLKLSQDGMTIRLEDDVKQRSLEEALAGWYLPRTSAIMEQMETPKLKDVYIQGRRVDLGRHVTWTRVTEDPRAIISDLIPVAVDYTDSSGNSTTCHARCQFVYVPLEAEDTKFGFSLAQGDYGRYDFYSMRALDSKPRYFLPQHMQDINFQSGPNRCPLKSLHDYLDPLALDSLQTLKGVSNMEIRRSILLRRVVRLFQPSESPGLVFLNTNKTEFVDTVAFQQLCKAELKACIDWLFQKEVNGFEPPALGLPTPSRFELAIVPFPPPVLPKTPVQASACGRQRKKPDALVLDTPMRSRKKQKLTPISLAKVQGLCENIAAQATFMKGRINSFSTSGSQTKKQRKALLDRVAAVAAKTQEVSDRWDKIAADGIWEA